MKPIRIFGANWLDRILCTQNTVLFEFEGYKFIQGTNAAHKDLHLVGDYNHYVGEEVFYELTLKDFHALCVHWMMSKRPGFESAIETLRTTVQGIVSIPLGTYPASDDS